MVKVLMSLAEIYLNDVIWSTPSEYCFPQAVIHSFNQLVWLIFPLNRPNCLAVWASADTFTQREGRLHGNLLNEGYSFLLRSATIEWLLAWVTITHTPLSFLKWQYVHIKLPRCWMEKQIIIVYLNIHLYYIERDFFLILNTNKRQHEEIKQLAT